MLTKLDDLSLGFQFATENGHSYLKVALSDYMLLNHSILNKGMAFPHEERIKFGLLGLLPPHVANLPTQRERSYETFHSKKTPLEKYIYLRDLQDSNETLFYSLISEHFEEFLPIIYTPTVGLGCQTFSHVYRRPRGIYLTYAYRDQIDLILANKRFNHVKVIAVSDGERILGLGDQGAGGMGIPIGKLSLYTACAGIHPSYTLPILLDTGTNNQDLIKDPLYIGWRHERVRGQEYDQFVEQFVSTIQKRFPHCLLQWEDFAKINSTTILERYRHQLCTFNDDIQGTAAVAVGTLLAAINITGIPLQEQRIVVVGAGSAGCGISQLLKLAMMEKGLSEKETLKKFYLVDEMGLLTQDITTLLPFQKYFSHARETLSHWQYEHTDSISLLDVIKNVHPTILIGVSGQSQIFTEKLIREMASHVKQPIIFPLSNPTDKSEAIPTDLLKWTNDRAIISTGSPFGYVIKNGKTFHIDQTNNCYIFPGLGLGLIAVQARYVSDNIFMVAAKALAEASPSKSNVQHNLLPPLNMIRDISLKIAVAVAQEAITSGLAQAIPEGDLTTYIQQSMWVPEYLPYIKADTL